MKTELNKTFQSVCSKIFFRIEINIEVITYFPKIEKERTRVQNYFVRLNFNTQKYGNQCLLKNSEFRH